MKRTAKIKFKLHMGKYILCRISVNKTEDEFSTGFKVSDPSKFREGDIISTKKADLEAREGLLQIAEKADDIPINMYTTAKVVKEILTGKRAPASPSSGMPETILTVMDYHSKSKAQTGDHSFNSEEYYDKIYNSFERFLNDYYGITDIHLTEITKKNIRDYYSWLISTGVKSEYSRYQYCTAISTAVNFVVNEFMEDPRMIKYNPIGKVIKRPRKDELRRKSRSNHLSETDAVENIMKTEVHGRTNGYPNEWWKCTALFQTYSGFSFVDLGNTHWRIISGEDLNVIEMHRIKTSIPSYIPIMPHLQEIIDKLREFQEKYNTVSLFPIRPFVNRENTDKDKKLYDTEYSNYRGFLTALSGLLGVKIKTHTLRHTFGMDMVNKYGFSIDEVAIMMGHTNSQTTSDNYAAVSANRIRQSAIKKLNIPV